MNPCHLYRDTSVPQRNVFERVLGFNWYDGPISGLATCNCCGSVYLFTMLAIDEAFESRAFGIFPRELQQFDSLVSTLSVHETPKWPMWLPTDQQCYSGSASRAKNERPGAIILTSRYMDVVLSTHLVTTADNDFTEWDFENENSNCWLGKMLAIANEGEKDMT